MHLFSHFRLTYQSRGRPSVREKSARSTPSTKSPNTRREKTQSTLKERDVTIVSSRVMEVKPNRCSTKRPKPQRRLYWRWSAQPASTKSSCPSRDASTLSSEETRRRRDRWSSFKLLLCSISFFSYAFTRLFISSVVILRYHQQNKGNIKPYITITSEGFINQLCWSKYAT